MNAKKIFGLGVGLLVLASTVMAQPLPQTLPRNQTLYFGGLIWGPPQNFSPLSTSASFPVSYQNNWLFVYETMFLYNLLTNGSEPLVGKSFAWDKDGQTLRVELNSAAKFSDGKPLTAADVAYSYMLAKRVSVPWASYMDYIESVTASKATEVVIKMSAAKPNRLYILDSLNKVPVLPKHIWEAKEKEAAGDPTKLLQDFNKDPIGSGPYKVAFYDDTRVVAQRDDSYWGKAVMGSLPAPKYVAHLIYKSNDAAANAFRQHEIDVNQQFMPKIWDLWKNGEPFKTYLDEPPYFIPAVMPSLYFNMTKAGIGNSAESASVRRAIAMSIDYKKVADIAMSGYSATVVPGIILQVPSEKALVDEAAVKNLQYGFDVNGANKLLDSIGAMPGADGIRVLKDGTRLGPWEVSCPYGWSDWNASLEIVVQSAKKVGIDLRTKFPEFPTWYNDVKNGNFDIAMWNTTGPGVAQPWDRARAYMDSTTSAPIGQPVVASYNYGRYKNARADELIDMIPKETDKTKLKALYTELNKIFLTDLPQVQLMYRPGSFYEVYEGVWTGMPSSKNNPKNIPPSVNNQGAFIKMLYNIKAK